MKLINFKTAWDLNFLYLSIDDPNINNDIENQKIIVDAFCAKRLTNDAYLSSEEFLLEALGEYDVLIQAIQYGGKPGKYFHYLQVKDMDNADLQARVNKINDLSVVFQNKITFFELSLSKIDERTQNQFLNSELLSDFHNRLKCLFRDGKFRLSEKEEFIINQLSKVSYDNWSEITKKLLANESANMNIDGVNQIRTFEELLTFSHDENANIRKDAVDNINAIINKNLTISEIEMNSLFEFRKNIDALRNINRPDLKRIYSDDLEEQVVDTLNSAVIERFDISQRYYELKARLLGRKQIGYNERNLPINKNNESINIEDAIQLVGETFQELDTDFFEVYKSAFEDGRVDVFPSKGKRGGAFCSFGIKGLPVIMLNYTNKKRDVSIIAHEFGHGIHRKMMGNNRTLNTHVGTFVAETPSTFCEDFVFQKLLITSDDESKFHLLFLKISDQINTIQRQIACYNFEKDLHREYREKGYLGHKDIGVIFKKRMSSYCGKSVNCDDGFENRWLHWSHIRSYFYVYAYAGGLLISKALQALVKKDKSNLDKVKIFFKTGTSEDPKSTFLKLGIDITSKDFRNEGLSEMEKDLIECEALAKKLGKI